MIIDENDFEPARVERRLTPGQAVRAARSIMALSQQQLAEQAGLAQSTISAIENGREQLGRSRAMALAQVLDVHPGVLMFPGWGIASDEDTDVA